MHFIHSFSAIKNRPMGHMSLILRYFLGSSSEYEFSWVRAVKKLSKLLPELSFPVRGHRQYRRFELFSSVKLIKRNVRGIMLDLF